MKINKSTAVTNLANVLATISVFGDNDEVHFSLSNGRLMVSRVPARKPEPVFDCVKITPTQLKVGDMTYFEYTDLSWHTRTRRGVVTQVDSDSVLIFDFEAENHETGERGAYRRSKIGGMTNVYRLTDYLPF